MAKDLSKTKGTIRKSLSECIAEIDARLVTLYQYVHDGKLSPDIVVDLVKFLNKVLNVVGKQWDQNGELFASVGLVSESIEIGNCIHISGHHAAIEEAMHFLDELWFTVDTDDWKATHKSFAENPGDDNLDVELVLRCTGLNPSLISENWEAAKPVVCMRFNDAWWSDYRFVSPRIQRERSHLKAKQHSPLENCDVIPAEYRTKTMSKAQAAKLLGRSNRDSGVKWLNQCIADGTITCESLSCQSHIFDCRQFPKSVHDQIQIRSN